MAKHWILLSLTIIIIMSCEDSISIKEKESSLLSKPVETKVTTQIPKAVLPDIFIVSLKEGTLLNDPSSWSKANGYITNGKFYFGSKAQILETNNEGKRRYLKLKLNDGTEGWTSDWLIIEDASRAIVSSKSVRLYKKADIAAFTNEKLLFGQKIALGNKVIGGFHQIVYLGTDKKPHLFWIKQKDIRHISKRDNDYILAEYLERLQTITSTQEKYELIEEIKENEEFVTSRFYSKIMDIYEEDEIDFNTEKNNGLNLTPSVVKDEF